MKRLRPVVAAVLVGVASWPAAAAAQAASSASSTGTGGPMANCPAGLQISNIASQTPRTTQDPLTISRSDCLANFNLEFTYGYAGLPSNKLEVWGVVPGTGITDCITSANRLSGCSQILDARPQNAGSGGVLTIPSADVAFLLPSVMNFTCDDSNSSSTGDTVQLFVMAVGSDSEDAVDYCEYDAAVDLVGPTPPTNMTVGPGDGALIIDFTISSETDTIGYNVYCDDGTGVAGMGGGSASSASGGTGGAGGAGGSGVTNGAGASAPGCALSKALVPGTDPDPSLFVTTQNAPSISAKESNKRPMVNGKTYACGVSAVDTVGNAGKLSAVICGTPEPNDDFFGQYRADGGQGGGGLCAIGHGSRAFAAVAGVIGLALLGLGARRRPRRRGRHGVS